MSLAEVERTLRNHTASHIAQDAGWGDVNMPADPCGWCGGFECSVKINKGKAEVTCVKFTNLPGFSIKQASKKNRALS